MKAISWEKEIHQKDGSERSKSLILQKIIEILLIVTVIFSFVTILYEALTTTGSLENRSEIPLIWK